MIAGLAAILLFHSTGIAIAQGNETGLLAQTTAPDAANPSYRANASSAPSIGPLAQLGNLSSLSGGQPEILDPEDAFVLTVGDLSNGELPLEWMIQDGYFLYEHKFAFKILEPGSGAVSATRLSEGKQKTDEFFGDVIAHRNLTTADLTLSGLSDNIESGTIEVRYQGCADVGICYPPIVKTMDFGVVPANFVASTESGSTPPNPVVSDSTSVAPVAEHDALADKLLNGNALLTMLTFFGLGLLLTFTPCVLPMIPILSSIIVGDGDKVSTGRAFRLSIVYVLAMALTYTVAGVIVGLSGENVQAALQHPYVISATAILFVALALSMFGLYELQMPQSIQNRLTAVSGNQKGGRYSGVAIMGVLSALIVGPCVTAPLVGALLYIAQTGDAVLGGAALFALSMGMGLPLLLIGTSFGRLLPKAGGWMDTVKIIFGIAMLAMAIWMLDRIAPGWLIMLLAAVLVISVGVLLNSVERSESVPAGIGHVAKGLGYTSVIYGTLLLIGVASGGGSLTTPLKGLVASNAGGGGTPVVSGLVFEKIKGVDGLNAKLASAKTNGQPVMLDFYADWCVSCKEMEAYTFTDSKVIAKLSGAMLLKADVTANDDQDKALLEKFGLFGPPATLFYNTDGAEQANYRVMGYMKASKFTDVIDGAFAYN